MSRLFQPFQRTPTLFRMFDVLACTRGGLVFVFVLIETGSTRHSNIPNIAEVCVPFLPQQRPLKVSDGLNSIGRGHFSRRVDERRRADKHLHACRLQSGAPGLRTRWKPGVGLSPTFIQIVLLHTLQYNPLFLHL